MIPRRAALVLLAGSAGLLPAIPRAAAPALRNLRVGIAAPTVNMLPIWVADAAGLFRAHGFGVDIVDTGGGSRGLGLLRDGQLNVMNVGLSAVIEENAKGADLRLVASSANTMSFGFFGAPGVTAGAALRGKKVGISTLHSESDIAATLALRKLGLARNDVQLVEIGTTLQRLEALGRGEVAATPLNEPVNIIAAQRGMPKLADLTDDTPWILNGLVFNRRDLAQDGALVLDFLRAYTEAIHAALVDQPRTEETLVARFGMLAPEIAHATYADFKRRIPRDAAPSPAAAANMLEALPQLGVAVGSREIGDYVDGAPIAALEREGWFDRLAAKYPVRA